jgi:hypothetical protein
MAGRMNESYYDEKKDLALTSIGRAANNMREAEALIAATKYSMPDLVEPGQVRGLLKSAALALDAARRDFEKSRWAAASTNLEFEQWLSANGCDDLRMTQD